MPSSRRTQAADLSALPATPWYATDIDHDTAPKAIFPTDDQGRSTGQARLFPTVVGYAGTRREHPGRGRVTRAAKVAVVGAGVAGTMLALRLAENGVPVDLFTGARPRDADATGASGGLVRGYEPDPRLAAVAAASVAEIRSDPRMRDWTGYQEVGSAYVTDAADPPDPAALDATRERLPGSLRVVPADELPLRGLPDGAVAVLERHAGFISPARLRDRALAELRRAGVTIHTRHITAVTADAVRAGSEGFDGYRAVVVAAGAWSRDLVGGALTTRHIQYGVYPARVAGLPSFVDETSGLYGRPAAAGRTLLGISSDRWGLRPEEISPDRDLSARVTACATDRLGMRVRPERVVASFDCYCESAGLELRRAGDALTFTGGSGGAAKSVVAASRLASRDLMAVLEGVR
ncbi:MAG TPA: FAD-dependent oxidoreductase [Pseudonocardiaceae bacterium]|nr:FAD-dependent oxidoreductase [Pseudonocardiaceae bacterium]